MIYLKPIGGLCNRLRTIDSMFSWCSKHKNELTIIWVKDASLNCSFNEIFELSDSVNFDFQVLDCPIGYPEKYPSAIEFLKRGEGSKKNENHPLIRCIKNILKGRFLNREQREIRNGIHTLMETRILTNEDLAVIYDSEKHIGNKSAREMDALFIPLVKPRIEALIKNNANTYISSCYRLFPIENRYDSFKPSDNILSMVDGITKNFNNTVGLHIRRTDHVTSKTISTTEKFMQVIDRNLDEKPNTTFFVSTDDAITKGELVNKYGDIMIANNVSSYDRNKKNAARDAVVDLYCLSRTKKIYGSHHSSFSQTAADIGGIEEETVK